MQNVYVFAISNRGAIITTIKGAQIIPGNATENSLSNLSASQQALLDRLHFLFTSKIVPNIFKNFHKVYELLQ